MMASESHNFAFNLQNVGKTYPHFQLSDISLQLEKGRIMGFIGPNGAGKSTTIRILMGLIKQDTGKVDLFGQGMPEHQISVKWDIGYASEDMRLYANATIDWHINFMNSIFPNWDMKYSKTLLERFDLVAEQKIQGLSHGQRVKANLLMVLARRPKLLLLDEPTTGLDPVARHQLINELMDVLLDDERSILYSSHNTQDIEQLSDLITFIDKGKIIATQEKESYLESWRRIRLNLNDEAKLPNLQGVVEQRQSGQQAIVTTKRFNSELTEIYSKCGATVQSVENMNLEEIFVSEIQSNRLQSNQANGENK